MLDEEADEMDQLAYNEERRYMNEIEKLVQNKVNDIGEPQALALINIRKEFYRRDVTIRSLLDDLHESEDDRKKLNEECENLTNTAIGLFKYKESLKKENKRLELELQNIE